MICVQTLSALQSYNDAVLSDGEQAYLATGGPFYLWLLDRSSSAEVDDVTVVMPSTGQGRWLRILPDSSGGGSPVGPIVLSGDADGPSDANVVNGLLAIAIDPTPPDADDVLSFDGSQLVFGPVPVAFTITSFTMGGSLLREIGSTLANPNFGAAYSSAASSARIANNDYQPSFDLSAPYTNGTVPYSFIRNINTGTVVFTLLAQRGATSRSATLTVTWGTRIYYGPSINPAGATEAFIEGLMFNVLSTTRNGSYSIMAGTTMFGYFCLPSGFGTPTFTIGGFETTFNLVASNVPVTNAYGITTNYNVWRSGVIGLGTFVLVVT